MLPTFLNTNVYHSKKTFLNDNETNFLGKARPNISSVKNLLSISNLTLSLYNFVGIT